MEYWHEILKKYDDLNSKDPELKNHGLYSQSAVVALLLYLAFGEDHGYNIIKYFENKYITSIRDYYYEQPDNPMRNLERKQYMSSLRTNKIYSLLDKMEEDELVIAKKGFGKTRPKNIYSINPRVLQSPIRQGTYIRYDGSTFEIPLKTVEQILPLRNLEWREDISYTARDGLFENVVFDKNINFFTFLRIIEDWIEMESTNYHMANLFRKPLNDYWGELDYLAGDYIYSVPSIADLKRVKLSMAIYSKFTVMNIE